MTTHTPHPQSRQEPSHTQVQALRRPNHRRTRTFRRFAAGAAALALAATGAIAAAPGTATADTHRDNQWYLDDFNINKIHELSQGEGVKIGVIDSGIDPNHPDLEGNIEAGTDYGDSTGKGLNDPVGHGTSVASVMAGHGHGKNNADGILGIAPKATIISVGIVWDGSSRQGHEFTDAFQYLVDRDVNIIMTSQGAAAPDAIGDKAIEPAEDAGIPIVAPSGNTAEDDNTTWPARASGVIPVTGTNQNHKFWNGSTTLAYASQQPQLGLSAPATNIPIAMPNGKYDNADGTSFSTPIVAGTLALIKSAYPTLGAWDVENRLLETVDDKGPEGFDDKYGWGIVNPYKALTEETTFTDADGNDTVSSPNDRLPLEKQGAPVDNYPPPDNTTKPLPTPDDEAATDTPTGPPAWLTITIITAGALLTTALITLVIVKTRRSKKNPTSQGTGPLPPGQPGPLPTAATPERSPHAFPPPQNQDQAPPPNPPGLNQQPTDAPWQPPHDPNTNPPHQPPQ